MALADSSKNPSAGKSSTGQTDSNTTNIVPELRRELHDIEDDTVNEQSPLLPANGSSGDGSAISALEDVVQLINDAHEFKSSGYMFLLTFGAFGYGFQMNR